MEVLTTILGLAAMYSWVHFAFIQHAKAWKDRTEYEKAVTIIAIVMFALYVVGTVS